MNDVDFLLSHCFPVLMKISKSHYNEIDISRYIKPDKINSRVQGLLCLSRL